MTTIHVDILIHNGQVLTMNAEMEVIPNGVIAILGTTIVAVGTSELLETYVAKKIIDAEQGIVMPGMVNTHCHLPMIAFRGLGEEGIEDRLMGYFMPLEKELLSRKLIYEATIHGAIDMAMGGVTTYADMYYHVDEMAKATLAIGLRAVLGQTVIGFPVVDAPTPYGGLDYARRLLDFFEAEDLVSLALAPHAPYTVSKEKLQEVKAMADRHNLLVHLHVAEFEQERYQISENTKQTSVIDYLDTIGVLGSNTLLAHCNYVTNQDFERIAAAGARIAHNPLANAKGATGTARIVEALQYDIPIGLGTDGPMGSNVVDVFKVMTYTTTIQRIRKMNRTVMTPAIVVRMATMGGAEALRMDHKIGSLEEGKLADIVIVETESSNMIPNYDPYATLVFQANPHNVAYTIVNGKIIVEKRQLMTYSMDKNRKQMEHWYKKIQPFAMELAKKAKQNTTSI